MKKQPNHKIIIKNLGPLKDIKDFEVKNFNLLIGKSAAGKSVLAKTVFLFNYAFSDWQFPPGPLATLEKAYDYISELLRDFFPQYRSYKIEYRYTKDFSIVAERSGKSMSIKFSPKLISRHRKMVRDVKEFFNKERAEAKAYRQHSSQWHEYGPKIYGSFKDDLNLSRTIFVPAARSVVSDFDRSRLRLLNRARQKELFQDNLLDKISEGDVTLRLFSNDNMDSIENFQQLSEEYEEIAKGKVYKQHGDQIVLTTMDGKQTLTADQWSSGQKEVVPILMLLQYIAEKNIQTFLIIEEPEAHLFPEDQRALLGKIASVAKATESKVFVTTHNPILLMATNNLIEAEKREYKDLEARFLPYAGMQACKLENGKCESIMDKKVRLIDGDYIENETEEVMDEFDKIVDSKL